MRRTASHSLSGTGCGVREDRPNGWLFISSNADTHASLKPVISMWLSIAIRGLLAMGENRNRRVWIFADELPTLHKLPDLVEILPEARKFGGCYVFGIQSMPSWKTSMALSLPPRSLT
ncbi:Coupling protein TraD [Klebsiella pneumoniae]|nr:Coupling protein TraD [Klebsiella pneumoniae]